MKRSIFQNCKFVMKHGNICCCINHNSVVKKHTLDKFLWLYCQVENKNGWSNQSVPYQRIRMYMGNRESKDYVMKICWSLELDNCMLQLNQVKK